MKGAGMLRNIGGLVARVFSTRLSLLAVAAGTALMASLHQSVAIQAAPTALFFFEFNSARLTERSQKAMQLEYSQQGSVYGILRWYRLPDFTFYLCVEGHTALEESGADLLSLQRASLVESELVKAGIPAALIYTSSFGATRPIMRRPQDQYDPSTSEYERAVLVKWCNDKG